MKVESVNLSEHMPTLDGIRGIAILAVLIFHATIFQPTAPVDYWYHKFGTSFWIGVDLFFVLSGFLITGILYDAKNEKLFFRNFYARRALRIFPLYFLVLGVAIFVLPHWLSRFPKLGSEQWWYWTYLSNFHLTKQGLSHLVLGPTWSLAIEEQFYVVWPLLVFFCSRKVLMGICGLIALTAMVIRLLLLDAGAHHNVVYLSTYTRMDALAIGAFLALWARGTSGIRGLFPWIWFPLAVCGAVTLHLLVGGNIERKATQMIGYGYSSVGLFFGAALICAVASPVGGWAHWLLTRKLLLFFGKYSYAIYLFNRPFVDILEDNLFHPNDLPLVFGSSIPGQLLFSLVFVAIPTALALISWHLFEKRFLLLKRYFTSPPKS